MERKLLFKSNQIKFTTTVLKCSKFKMQNKLFKTRTLERGSNIQIRNSFQNKTKQKQIGKLSGISKWKPEACIAIL